MPRSCHTIIAFVILITVVNANDDTSTEKYLTEVETSLRRQYVECTGDLSVLPLKRILAWKERFDSLCQTQSYAYIRSQYAIHGDTGNPIAPCRFFTWYDSFLLASDHQAASMRAHQAESLYIFNDQLSNPASPYDYRKYHFGIGTKTLGVLVRADLHTEIVDSISSWRIASAPIAGQMLPLALLISPKNIYYGYAAQCDSWPVDSLDTRVRSDAASLAKALTSEFGAPDDSFLVGRNDLANNRLTILRRWQNGSCSAIVGICMHGYRYAAKIVVVDKKFITGD